MVIWAAEDFEEPSYDEGWDEIIIIRGGEVIVQSFSNES